MTGARTTWTLATAPGGALAAFVLTGEIDAALHALGVGPVPIGACPVRTIPGVDDAVISRPSPALAIVTVHAGRAVADAMERALDRAGITEAQSALGVWDSPLDEAPELSELLWRALSAAPSPRAVDLLLDQPRRWAFAGARTPADVGPDPERERALAHLLRPPVIAAVGRSNVGKSTLLNALADQDVALVAPEPGTTRDHVGAALMLDGLTVRWLDTPGLRDDPARAERDAMAIAASEVAAADLVVLVSKPDRAPPAPEHLGVAPDARMVFVATHADERQPVWPADLAICAITGQGLDELARLVRTQLVPERMLTDDRPWRFWMT